MGNLGKKEIDIAQVSDFFSQSTGFVLDPGLAASRFAPIHLAAAILEGGSLRNLEQDWLRRTFPYSWPQPSWRGGSLRNLEQDWLRRSFPVLLAAAILEGSDQ